MSRAPSPCARLWTARNCSLAVPVAPGDFHLALAALGRGYRVRLTQSPPVHHCRPSVDILFRSAAELAGDQAVAVLLTGMGVDGARGLQSLRVAGSRTLAQDEESCVVFGMPQAAIKLDAAEEVVHASRDAASHSPGSR